VLTEARTSSTAFVDSHDYPDHPFMAEIEARIAEITNLPVENQETFQVLRYNGGEYYRAHYDYIPEHGDMPCGARVATFFLYMSDVEEGGETHFPTIHMKLKPKKGSAVLWYVLDLIHTSPCRQTLSSDTKGCLTPRASY
jgi:prolyl 4-hydroxylase